MPLASDRTRILIAEDSNSDRLLLKSILEQQGHDVVVASDGRQAIDVYQKTQPGIILLDALMPNMDGFEAAEKIRQLAGEEFIPIIFLTSLQEADSLAACLDAGGDDFLSKPYNSVILGAKINAFVRMREMHRVLQHQRDQISAHNERLLREQEVAKKVFDKVAHAGCLDAPNIQYSLSPTAVFNGDVALAGVSPAGDLVVLLGDFTGHGLDAAIGAMPLAQSFYSMLEKGFSLQDIIREINVKLHEVLPTGVFCCALVADIDFHNGVLKVWNGGLPDGVIYHSASKQLTHLKSRHLPFGIRDNHDFNDSFETYEIFPGDRLFMWSDGILEAQNDNEEMFGEKRVLDVFSRNKIPELLFDEVNFAVNSFICESGAGDDVSLISVEIVEPNAFTVEVPKFNGGQQTGPKDWSLHYELRPDTLRDFDPLPLLLHSLMQVPFLRSFGSQIYTVMAELYTNALEHGLLKLDSSLKDSSEGFDEYYLLRELRLRSLHEGVIAIRLDYLGSSTGGHLTIEVEDSGEGFDYQSTVDRANADYSGRGISLLRSICESVQYLEHGNRVVTSFTWGDAKRSVQQ